VVRGIAHAKEPGDAAGMGKAILPHDDGQHDEQKKPFGRGFIELARVTRQRSGSREDEGPGHIAHAAPQFAIHEIRDATEHQPERRHGSGNIEHGEGVETIPPRPEEHRHACAEQATMKGHAALPDLHDLQRVLQKITGMIEEGEAQATANHHAKGRIDQKVIELFRCRRFQMLGPEPRIGCQLSRIIPATEKPQDIGQRIPSHDERADGKRDGIELGKEHPAFPGWDERDR